MIYQNSDLVLQALVKNNLSNMMKTSTLLKRDFASFKNRGRQMMIMRNGRRILTHSKTSPFQLQAGDEYFWKNANRWFAKKFSTYTQEARRKENGIDDLLGRIIETLICSITMFKRARDGTDIYQALVMLCHGIGGKCVYYTLNDLYKNIFGSSYETQSGPDFIESLNTIRGVLDDADRLLENPLGKKIHRIFLHCLAMGMFERFGFSISDVELEKSQAMFYRSKMSKKMFLWSLLDGVTFVAQRAYWAYKTGSWSAFLHSEETYSDWADKVYQLRIDALKLHNPNDLGLDYHQFVKDVNDAISFGNEIVKCAGKDEKKMIQKCLFDLKRIQIDEITKSAVREERRTPLGVLLAGNSGVAKSSLTKLLFYHYGKVRNLPTHNDFLYTRTIGEDFWSSFATHQWAIRIDDIANQNPNMGLDPSIKELLYIVNNVPYTPAQAELELKGKTPLKPELVLCTTNVPNLNATCYYENSLAVQRRFPFTCWVEIKPEYSIDDEGVMLDPARVPKIMEGSYPDLWNITVMKIKPVKCGGKQRGELVPEEKYTDIYAFLRSFSVKIWEHNANQDQALELDEQIRSVELCWSCTLPVDHCSCFYRPGEDLDLPSGNTDSSGGDLETQSGDDIVVSVAPYLVLWFIYYIVTTCFIPMVKRKTLEIYTVHVAPCVSVFLQQSLTSLLEKLKPHVEEIIERQADRVLPSIDQHVSDLADNAQTHLDSVADEVKTACLNKINRSLCLETLKEGLQAIYQRVMSNMPSKWSILFGVLGTITMLYGIYYASKEFSRNIGEEQAYTEENPREDACFDGNIPTNQDEKENVWVKDDFVPTDLELNRHTRSWKSLDQQRILEKMSNNVRRIKLTFDRDGKTFSRCFTVTGVGGHLFVANHHSFPTDIEHFTAVVSNTPELTGVTPNFTLVLYQKDIFRQEDRDLAWFELRNCPPVRNLMGLMLKRPMEKFSSPATMVMCKPETEFRPVSRIVFKNVSTPNLGEYSAYVGLTPEPTKKGDCGSPYIVWHPCGPIFVGIHTLGNDDGRAVAFPMFVNDVDEAMAHFGCHVVEQAAPDLEDRGLRPVVLQKLHHKSVFRYIEEGTAEVYGSLPGFRQTHMSKVTDSLIHDDLVELGFSTEYTAPVMKGWEIWRNGALPVVQQFFGVKQYILQDCVKSFSQDILDGISTSTIKAELQMLDMRVVVNGSPGVRFIDGMNFSSSMGYPWKCKKVHHVESCAAIAPWQVMVEFKPDVMARVAKIWDKYAHGERACPVFTAHLKDEPVKMKKVIQKKTRVFSGAPVDWVMVVRKVLLPFIRLFQLHPFVTEGAVGMNPFSSEWDRLFHYLTHFGTDFIVAGDFSSFDKRMQATFILAAFDVIIQVHKEAGWTEQQLRVIACIAEDTAFAYTDYNGDLVQFFGSNPSGHSLTVIINSIVNCLYMRYCYAQMEDADLSKFKTHVRLMTYGDDNIMGISPKISHIFNHTFLVDKLAEIGVVYTMADKERATVPLLSIWETTFLKRYFVFDYTLDRIVGPLEEESNIKTLMKRIPSQSIHENQRVANAMSSVCMEMWWYGPEKFEDYRNILMYLGQKYSLFIYGLRLPSWQELYVKFSEPHICRCVEDMEKYIVDPNLDQLYEKLSGVHHTIAVSPTTPTNDPEQQLLADIFDRDESSVGCSWWLA